MQYKRLMQILVINSDLDIIQIQNLTVNIIHQVSSQFLYFEGGSQMVFFLYTIVF